MPSDQSSLSEGRIHRWSYIHRKVKELGFPGLGEYLCTRYIQERQRVEDMARECNVRTNTIRKHLRFYGLEVGTPRAPKPTQRKGRTLVCTECGRPKYYSPSLVEKLNEETYRCRPCRTILDSGDQHEEPS